MNIDITYSGGRKETFNVSDSLTRIEIRPMPGDTQVVASVKIPMVDIITRWFTSLAPGLARRIPWAESLLFGAQKNFPVYVLLNHAGRVRAALESTNLIDDGEIHIAFNQEKCTCELTLTTSLRPETQPFAIILDQRDASLSEALDAWRKELSLPQTHYPEKAYEPVYCTWYVVHGEVDQAFVERTCPLAKAPGFSTLIVDDGWCYDEYKRVSPQTIPDWYETIGDWNVSSTKFPDFKNHVKRMQAIGMNYLLWVAPHLIGKKSAVYQKIKEQTTSDYVEGYYKLDLNKADTTLFVQKLRALAKDNGLDGLKIDFLDIVVPNPQEPNSAKTRDFIAALTGALKEDNPNALIEFRQSYATPAMLQYGTQFRAGDAPFDWKLNFGRLVEIRLNIGNLGPVHADPAYWAPGELPENIARHLMAMLVGVPMLSMDLEKLTDLEKRLIRHYVGFYNSHKNLINHGKWDVIYGQTEIAAATVENDQERMAILCDAHYLDEALGPHDRNTWVMNLSSSAISTAGATECIDAQGLPAPDGTIPVGGSGKIVVSRKS